MKNKKLIILLALLLLAIASFALYCLWDVNVKKNKNRFSSDDQFKRTFLAVLAANASLGLLSVENLSMPVEKKNYYTNRLNTIIDSLRDSNISAKLCGSYYYELEKIEDRVNFYYFRAWLKQTSFSNHVVPYKSYYKGRIIYDDDK